jgi:hypothetical protein
MYQMKNMNIFHYLSTIMVKLEIFTPHYSILMEYSIHYGLGRKNIGKVRDNQKSMHQIHQSKECHFTNVGIMSINQYKISKNQDKILFKFSSKLEIKDLLLLYKMAKIMFL